MWILLRKLRVYILKGVRSGASAARKQISVVLCGCL